MCAGSPVTASSRDAPGHSAQHFFARDGSDEAEQAQQGPPANKLPPERVEQLSRLCVVMHTSVTAVRVALLARPCSVAAA